LPQHPRAATTPNSKGKIPLHYAAREGRTDLVRWLLAQNPETAKVASEKQKLAIHFAAGDGHANTVHELLMVHPEGATALSSKGKLPLHLAARWGHLACVQRLCTATTVQARDFEGNLPLHEAARQAQVETAHYLWQFHPQALSVSNLRHEVPLYSAVRAACAPLIIAWTRAYPAVCTSIVTQLATGDVHAWWVYELLLRAATESPLLVRSKPIVTTEAARSTSPVLEQAPPKRFKMTFESGPFLALHAALRAQATLHVIKVAYEHSKKDSLLDLFQGGTALHWACLSNQHAAWICQHLVSPAACQVVDGQGRLPVDIAIPHHAALVPALVQAHPGCVTRQRVLAAATASTLDAVYALVQTRPTCVSTHEQKSNDD